MSLEGMVSSETLLAHHSDILSTLVWNSNTSDDRMYILTGKGLPFIYMLKDGSKQLDITLQSGYSILYHQDNIIQLATNYWNDTTGIDEGLPPNYMEEFYKRLIKVMADA